MPEAEIILCLTCHRLSMHTDFELGIRQKIDIYLVHMNMIVVRMSTVRSSQWPWTYTGFANGPGSQSWGPP